VDGRVTTASDDAGGISGTDLGSVHEIKKSNIAFITTRRNPKCALSVPSPSSSPALSCWPPARRPSWTTRPRSRAERRQQRR
jgi:hypothetical protein